MPNTGKTAAHPGGAKHSTPFEEALKKLESIVEEMESGELPLEKLLSRFEEGTQLVRSCQARLEEAEVRIQKLEKTAAGEALLKPLAENADE